MRLDDEAGKEEGSGARSQVDERLPRVRAALAVLAHPDDESFGLGAVLAALAEGGATVGVLCFTAGGASTLGAAGGQLATRRRNELAAAASVLGLGPVALLDYPDGHLAEVPLDRLAAEVERRVAELRPELLIVFDEGGITGHPDHVRASEAALAAHGGLPVLAWSVAEEVASTLNDELGTGFFGRPAAELDVAVQLDRSRQLEAIGCHESQSADNPVLWRRLELQGSNEVLRWLRPPSGDQPAPAGPSR